MTDDIDEKLGKLLREGAPSERDPLFRIGVLQRRERQRFQRRTHKLIGAAALPAVFAVVGASLGDRLPTVALIAVFCVAFIAAGLSSLRGMLLVVRRLRRN